MTHSHNARKKEPMPEQPEEQPQQNLPAVNIQFTPQGMVISQVVAVLGEDLMGQVVTKWLETHPALLAELSKQAVEAKQKELQIIRHINAKRND